MKGAHRPEGSSLGKPAAADAAALSAVWARRAGRARLRAPAARKVSEPEASKKRSDWTAMEGAATTDWMANAVATEGTTTRRRGERRAVRARRRGIKAMAREFVLFLGPVYVCV